MTGGEGSAADGIVGSSSGSASGKVHLCTHTPRCPWHVPTHAPTRANTRPAPTGFRWLSNSCTAPRCVRAQEHTHTRAHAHTHTHRLGIGFRIGLTDQAGLLQPCVRISAPLPGLFLAPVLDQDVFVGGRFLRRDRGDLDVILPKPAASGSDSAGTHVYTVRMDEYR